MILPGDKYYYPNDPDMGFGTIDHVNYAIREPVLWYTWSTWPRGEIYERNIYDWEQLPRITRMPHDTSR